MQLSPEQTKILDLIEATWKGDPNLRFLQMIGNCFGPVAPRDIYFVTDKEFLSCLTPTYIDPSEGEKDV